MDIFGNTLGISGMCCFLVAYFLLQKNVWKAHSYGYLGANFAGSLLLIASLCIDWNLSAFLLEVAWAAISLWGLVKLQRK